MTQMNQLATQIWDMKYRFKSQNGAPLDNTIEDTWIRVAKALSFPESESQKWEEKFYQSLSSFQFLPAGRILAGAGTKREVTLFNCFVMGCVPDDMEGIFEHLKEAALTMQQGGGIGYDFSTLRPKGAPVVGVGADASGPLTFMDVWDSMCRTIMSAGFRRGAMMGTLRCDHPDIEDFIEAKKDPERLRMFNLSVLISDDFMAAIKNDQPWELQFAGICYRKISARELWERIMQSTYTCAEPGVIFIDRVNKTNNLNYCEKIFSTNPCGEQPLPPYGACLLGSVNLASLVTSPFENNASIDISRLRDLVSISIRMLDNAITVSRFPLPAQAIEATSKRRIGLGITGLANALIMCGELYGSPSGNALMESWFSALRDEAYLTSANLAKEKGAFPLYESKAYLKNRMIEELDRETVSQIRRYGVRNALLTSIAPTGTISLLAGNISSGIEPVFNYSYSRKVLMPDGKSKVENITDYSYQLFKELNDEDLPLPEYFVNAQELSPSNHLEVQSLAQKYIDSSISKTINCPEKMEFEEFKNVYSKAFELGCKGCTTYRPNSITGAVLKSEFHDNSKTSNDLKIAKQQTELPLKPIEKEPVNTANKGGVIYMTQSLERPESLEGNTYKIRWPDSDHAIYITINDVVRDSRRLPFEIFINSKNTEHYAWTVGLTRMISAVFRRGGDISFVVEELQAVFDPRGGQWMEGRYVPSILAAIGNVIDHHLNLIGFHPQQQLPLDSDDVELTHSQQHLKFCSRCSQYSVIQQEGCDVCTACGFSKCA